MKAKTSKDPVPGQIKNYPAYATAVEKLGKLNDALSESSRKFDVLKMRARQVGERVSMYLNRGVYVMPASFGEREIYEAAVAVAASGSIPASLMDRLRSEAPPVPFEDDKYQREFIESVNDLERSIIILKRAVALQERDALELKNKAIAEASESFRVDRERIARRIATAVLELSAAIDEENVFLARVKSQDEAIVELLHPEPFPFQIQLEPNISRWVAAALGMSASEVQERMTSQAQQIGRTAR